MTTTPDEISTPEIPIYRIGVQDRITIINTFYKWISTDADGHVVAPERYPEQQQGLMHSEFHELMQNGGARIEQDFYIPVNIARRNGEMKDVPDRDAQLERYYAALCDAFLDRRERGEEGSSLSDTSLARALPSLASEVMLSTKGRGLPGPFSLPSPGHFRRLLNTYVESSHQPLALASRLVFSWSENPTFGHHDRQVWSEFAAMLGGPGRPTRATVFVALQAAIRERNLNRRQQGLPLLAVPSRRTFERFVRGSGPFPSRTGRTQVAGSGSQQSTA